MRALASDAEFRSRSIRAKPERKSYGAGIDSRLDMARPRMS